MSYSEAEFWQGVILALMVCLWMLSAVMGRLDQQEGETKTRKIPQEHDERFS